MTNTHHGAHRASGEHHHHQRNRIGVLTMNSLKSKTIQFSLLLAVLSVVQGYVSLLPLDQQGQMVAGLVISVAVAVLRVLTSVPLSEK